MATDTQPTHDQGGVWRLGIGLPDAAGTTSAASLEAAAAADRIPAGRWGTPADLTGATVFLASPASDYVSGIVLPVDGGWLAR